MKWINHVAIGGATTALINPALVPVAMLGATAPDWMEWIAKGIGRPVKHRGPTHYLAVWLVALLAAWILEPTGVLAAFAWGGLTHIICDAMTVSGVPFSPYSDRRFHLFGGRFRTGDPAEYAISFGVVAACVGVFMMIGSASSGWYPFFYDWHGLYNQGVIDGSEWRANRFRFF
ncbi:MAG: metal-dependent hydrolase [Marinospirillum sp.]|uniref:metal-dependent hydrolase n=1 Tax=Marinospirillum sp. TaxID=2183934 RepID=UPI0019E7B230|nr:metal-dependent hydrolase [Marinospirillum sp.]MBE0506969.1 metal-dependent hydrolase [Marinospirillum sp.]